MTNPPRRHLFTLEEAMALLPIIEPLVRDAQMKTSVLQQMQQNLDRTAQKKSQGNGHRLDEAAELQKLRQDANQMQEELQNTVREIHSFHVELKDPMLGLLDFRAMRDDREVYLCWRLGEPKIAYWHDLDTGFANRRPL